MHANFSTKFMREVGGKEYFEALMAAFEKNIMDHIAVYGPDNDKRLTGKHETAPWNKFSYGLADRSGAVDPRVPPQLHEQRGLQGLSRRPPPELHGRPLPDRLADPEDDRFRSGRGQIGGGLSDKMDAAWTPPYIQAVLPPHGGSVCASFPAKSLTSPRWL